LEQLTRIISILTRPVSPVATPGVIPPPVIGHDGILHWTVKKNVQSVNSKSTKNIVLKKIKTLNYE
jgi:hypothetical protein